jgi:hypothetical protein
MSSFEREPELLLLSVATDWKSSNSSAEVAGLGLVVGIA